MELTDREKKAVWVYMENSSDPDTQEVMWYAGPQGAALAILVQGLRAPPISFPDTIISCIEIAFSLKEYGNQWSRILCASGDCPVRGDLVVNSSDAHFNSTVTQALLAVQQAAAVKDWLSLAEVFPSRLRAVRTEWIKAAKRLFAPEEDFEADADTIELRVGLSPFVNQVQQDGCKGSSCPGRPVLVVKS